MRVAERPWMRRILLVVGGKDADSKRAEEASLRLEVRPLRERYWRSWIWVREVVESGRVLVGKLERRESRRVAMDRVVSEVGGEMMKIDGGGSFDVDGVWVGRLARRCVVEMCVDSG